MKSTKINTFISKLKPFHYTIHNFIGHPLMEIFHLLKYPSLGNKIHDLTLPAEDIEKPNMD